MRRFATSDIDEINGWYAARGLPRLEPWAFPSMGLVEPGVAAGFLYRTDSGLALLEGIVTNPAASASSRHAALTAIGAELVAEAKRAGIKRLLGICRDRGIAERAIAHHGMRPVGVYGLVAREV